MFWIIIIGIFISYSCYQLWGWANAHLFEYLGEIETCEGIKRCYAYDALSIPARIVCFLCGSVAIAIFILTWFSIYGMFIM